MKVVLLSRYDPTARFLHVFLGERHDVHLLRVAWPQPNRVRKPLLQRARALLDPARVLRRLTRLNVQAHYQHLHARLEEELFGGSPNHVGDRGDAPVVSAASLRGAAGTTELAKLRPDVVLVDGAPMLGREVLEVARIATVNVHFGIAPEYRGSHTLFWAMYRRDWAHVGATIHHVSPVLDGGAILARVYPELRANDDEASIMARCTTMAGTVLDELLTDLDRGPVAGMSQPKGGRCYRGAERVSWRHALLRARLAVGDGPPVRISRSERCWESPGEAKQSVTGVPRCDFDRPR